MASVYQGKYTFPVASTAERSIQQGAAAQAQMYAGLGKTFGDAIGTYFEAQDEKKAAESMAENQIALDVVYGGRDVPADQKQRIKDMRGVIRGSGGFKNFLGRIDAERANQRADRAEEMARTTQERMLEVHKQNVALGGFQLGAAKDAATAREAGEKYGKWLTTPQPVGPLSEEGAQRQARFQKQEAFIRQGELPEDAGKQLEREERYSRILAPHREKINPAEMTSKELSRYLSQSDLSSKAKMAGLQRVEQLKVREIAASDRELALEQAMAAGRFKALAEKRAATKAEQETTEFGQEQGQKDFSNTTIRGIDPSGNSINVKLKGVVGNLTRADKLREDVGLYNDAQAKLDELLKWAEKREELRWGWMSDDDKAKASRLATMVQSKMRKEVLGEGVVTEPEYKRLQEVVPNPATFWTGRVNALTQLESLKKMARDSFMKKLKGFGVTPAEGSASSVSTAARPSDGPKLPSGISGVKVTEISAEPEATAAPPPPGTRVAATPSPGGEVMGSITVPVEPQGKAFAPAETLPEVVEMWIEEEYTWDDVMEFFDDPFDGQARRARWEKDYGPFDKDSIKKRWDASGGRMD